MKVLCAFIATLAFAIAKPTEDKVHNSEHLLPTQMSRFDQEHLSSAVGDCTMREFTYSTVVCQREFYLSFRKDKTASCGPKFHSFKKCYRQKLRKCYEKVLSLEQLEKVLKQTSSALGEFKTMLCGETDFDVYKYFKALPKPEECPKGTMEKLSHCALTWYHLYRKDRGSLQLCSRYQKYANCAKRIVNQCTFDFSKMNWVFNEDLNPFCDKDQLEYHMNN